MSIESVMLSNHLFLCHPLSSFPQCFSASGSCPVSQLFTSGGQSIGASASIHSMNIQGWFSLGLTNLFSLQSKGLSRVFSSTTVWKHQLFGTLPSLFSSYVFASTYRWKNTVLFFWFKRNFTEGKKGGWRERRMEGRREEGRREGRKGREGRGKGRKIDSIERKTTLVNV